MNGESVQYDYGIQPGGLTWEPFDESGFASPWAPRLFRASAGINYAFSTLISGMVVVIFALIYEECRHWCMFPIMFCGSLIGADIIAWFRKEFDSFDPKAIVAGFLYLTCFLAPQLHVAYDIHHVRFYTFQNWPTYFGYMACFNTVGIILLKLAHNFFFKRSRSVKKVWQMALDRFVGILMLVLIISLVANAVIKFFFGGLAKEVGLYYFAAGSQLYAAHLSWIMMLGDPAPLLIVMTVIYWIQKRDPNKPCSFWTVLFILFFIFAVQFLLVGIRGSRTGILSAVFFIAAIIHFRLRPFSIKLLILGMIAAFVFSYLYDFYKKVGSEGWEVFYSAEALERLSYERRGATPATTLVFDLARADVQAFMLYRLMEHKGAYHYTWGKTYLMSALTVIPRGIWRNKPTPKVTAGGSILEYPALQKSTHQYGLAGEAMLNFGYYGILPAFFLLGSFLGWLRKKIATMEPSDSRFFLLPFLLFTCTFIVISDSDNLVQHLLRMGTLPFIVVFFGSIKSRFLSKNEEV
jgi:hypothetical protein